MESEWLTEDVGVRVEQSDLGDRSELGRGATHQRAQPGVCGAPAVPGWRQRVKHVGPAHGVHAARDERRRVRAGRLPHTARNSVRVR